MRISDETMGKHVQSIDRALSRNAKSAVIRKVGRGLYKVPPDHRIIGPLSATTEAVVGFPLALDRRDTHDRHTTPSRRG